MEITKANIQDFIKNGQFDNGIYVSNLITMCCGDTLDSEEELTDDQFMTLISFFTQNGIIEETIEDDEVVYVTVPDYTDPNEEDNQDDDNQDDDNQDDQNNDDPENQEEPEEEQEPAENPDSAPDVEGE